MLIRSSDNVPACICSPWMISRWPASETDGNGKPNSPRQLRIIEEETDRFVGDWYFREVAPTIRQLQQAWQQPKEDELQRLLNKLPDLDDRACQEIRRSFDRLTKKMLHRPVESLRHESAKGVPTALMDSLARLFRFPPKVDSPSPQGHRRAA